MAQSQQDCKRGATAGCLWTTSPLFPDWPPRRITKRIILCSSSPDMNYKGDLSSTTSSFLHLYFPLSLFLFWSLMPLGWVSVLLAACLCVRPSRLSACWQYRAFVHEMKQGAVFCQVPRLLLSAGLPTVLSSSSASSTRYLHLQGIHKVPSAWWEWLRVIRKQLKRQVLWSFHLCLLCQRACHTLMSQVMSQQWNEWTAVTPQIINNKLKFGS